ncbi:hypothetical protein CBM2585_B110043 [Cupriavidus taiwanensis]|nr:hypothetical protein CBM2585_B110043 [Cupriavidus taiwanensis]
MTVSEYGSKYQVFSSATCVAYRKEAERLILWAIARGKALSSLTTKDATEYRAFLHKPLPRERWVGPPRPRTAPDWRPFAGNLSARSVAQALAVLSAMFRWLANACSARLWSTGRSLFPRIDRFIGKKVADLIWSTAGQGGGGGPYA